MKPVAIACALLLTGNLHTQEAANPAPAMAAEAVPSDWSFAVSVYTYLPPKDDAYAQPTITADRDWLHLEARYNYEDLETGSVWVGYNLGVGDTPSLELTPMLGGVFGNTTGIAPGCHFTLGWWWLELYSESEYVFETSDHTESFFYSWSELTLSPLHWLHAGLVMQRTRVYQSELEIQRGFLVGLNIKRFEITGYMFNPDKREPAYVLSFGAEF